MMKSVLVSLMLVAVASAASAQGGGAGAPPPDAPGGARRRVRECPRTRALHRARARPWESPERFGHSLPPRGRHNGGMTSRIHFLAPAVLAGVNACGGGG